MRRIRLPAELLHSNAVTQSAALLSALRQTGDDWVLDASELCEFDSSALSVLLELQRESAKAGQALCIEAVPIKLRELAALYGVAQCVGTDSNPA